MYQTESQYFNESTTTLSSVQVVKFDHIFRLGGYNKDIDAEIQLSPFKLLAFHETIGENAREKIEKVCSSIARNVVIELIVIPDRYMSDIEVLQGLQMREFNHKRKGGIAFVFTATDGMALLDNETLPPDLLRRVYKISTIRHGFCDERVDENSVLMLSLARVCVNQKDSKLTEIVIRACHSAGTNKLKNITIAKLQQILNLIMFACVP